MSDFESFKRVLKMQKKQKEYDDKLKALQMIGAYGEAAFILDSRKALIEYLDLEIELLYKSLEEKECVNNE